MTSLLICALFAQLPASFAPGSTILRGPDSWLLVAPDGTAVAEFREVAGVAPVSITTLRDGTGVVFTASRAQKRDGLFILRGCEAVRDLSLSDGYHAWPTMSGDGKTIYFVHSPDAASGPMGSHGSGSWAQLWSRSLAGEANKQLTDSSGCKAAPFVYGQSVLYEHSSCRGTTGIELLARGSRGPRVVIPDASRREYLPRISPSGKMLATTSAQFGHFNVVVSKWPAATDARVVAATPEGQRDPSIAWCADSKCLIAVLGTEVVKIDIETGQQTAVWHFGSDGGVTK